MLPASPFGPTTPSTGSPDDVPLTRVEAARHLRVGVPTLERWGKPGPDPPPPRVGHATRCRPAIPTRE